MPKLARSIIAALAAALVSVRGVSIGAELPAPALDAIQWYDTLGFPDAKGLPYVRVATGLWSQTGNHTPENQFVEGFLLSAAPDSFTVFICSVAALKNRRRHSEPYPPLTTVRFIPKAKGPAWEQVSYENLDLEKVSSEVLERVRGHVSDPEASLVFGEPLAHRARIFAFARACLQNGLSENAAELMRLAANIPDEQNGSGSPATFRDILQQRIGDAVLTEAEADFRNPLLSWSELLKPYQDFDTRFPASKKLAYARESAELLRKMITEEAAHHPKPLSEMTPAEQVAENIYQLRNLTFDYWIANDRYPIETRKADGKDVITPVHRLVDLGLKSVPQLILALDDRRFTRTMVPDFHGRAPVDMRVGGVAQGILEHLSGRNLYSRVNNRGQVEGPTTRQLAEAWWAEVQAKGEKEALIQVVKAGDQAGYIAAQKLVAKFPDSAIEAIEAGMHSTPDDATRSEFIQAASALPDDAPVAFLKSKLASGQGLYSRVAAARALLARKLPDVAPAMIEAWQSVQPRLATNQSKAYEEVGGLIAFLANCGDGKAIEALGNDLQKSPVDVRLAVVRVFAPRRDNGGSSWSEPAVEIELGPPDEEKEFPKEASAAVERLLLKALDDPARRMKMELTYIQAAHENPRICDAAAFVLLRRWPEKYQFHWTADAANCDAQIEKMREVSGL